MAAPRRRTPSSFHPEGLNVIFTRRHLERGHVVGNRLPNVRHAKHAVMRGGQCERRRVGAVRGEAEALFDVLLGLKDDLLVAVETGGTLTPDRRAEVRVQGVIVRDIHARRIV